MEIFREMVNHIIQIGLENDVASLKRLSNLSYSQLARYEISSYYKLCAISHAAGILANRKKSLKRGLKSRKPFASQALLISCYGFKIANGILKVPLGDRQYLDVPLNNHIRKILFDSSLRVHSFALTNDSVNICISKDVAECECEGIQGVDRNLRNLTVGNKYEATQYELTKSVDIAENTRSIMKSFKRNDVRIRKRLYQKYGSRRKRRVNQLLHRLTKAIIQNAKNNKSAVAFEDIRNIRGMYRKGNYQGRNFRARMNSWSFYEVKRQIEYKAAWEGVPVIQLSVGETRGTSQLCPQCGKQITQVDRKTRQLFCAECKKCMDRDVVAAMNISIKGLQRFCSSKGLAGEAMVQESGRREPVILRVDASKLAFRRHREPKS
jgi:putative transposase